MYFSTLFSLPLFFYLLVSLSFFLIQISIQLTHSHSLSLLYLSSLTLSFFFSSLSFFFSPLSLTLSLSLSLSPLFLATIWSGSESIWNRAHVGYGSQTTGRVRQEGQIWGIQRSLLLFYPPYFSPLFCFTLPYSNYIFHEWASCYCRWYLSFKK